MKHIFLGLTVQAMLVGCVTTETVKIAIPQHEQCLVSINSRSAQSWSEEFGDIGIVEVVGTPSYFVPGNVYTDFGVMSAEEVKKRVKENKEMELDSYASLRIPKDMEYYTNDGLKRDIIRDLNGLPKRNQIPEFIIRIPKNGVVSPVAEQVVEAKAVMNNKSVLRESLPKTYLDAEDRKTVIEKCKGNDSGVFVVLKYIDSSEVMCMPKKNAAALFGCK